MSELLALAERCEKATGRDYEINKAIPTALGYVWNGALSSANPDGRWQKTAKGPFLKDDDFTGSIDAAMTLVPGGDPWTLGQNIHHRHWTASINEFGPDQIIRSRGLSSANTGPLALCAAALRARAADAGKGEP